MRVYIHRLQYIIYVYTAVRDVKTRSYTHVYALKRIYLNVYYRRETGDLAPRQFIGVSGPPGVFFFLLLIALCKGQKYYKYKPSPDKIR